MSGIMVDEILPHTMTSLPVTEQAHQTKMTLKCQTMYYAIL